VAGRGRGAAELGCPPQYRSEAIGAARSRIERQLWWEGEPAGLLKARIVPVRGGHKVILSVCFVLALTTFTDDSGRGTEQPYAQTAVRDATRLERSRRIIQLALLLERGSDVTRENEAALLEIMTRAFSVQGASELNIGEVIGAIAVAREGVMSQRTIGYGAPWREPEIKKGDLPRSVEHAIILLLAYEAAFRRAAGQVDWFSSGGLQVLHRSLSGPVRVQDGVVTLPKGPISDEGQQDAIHLFFNAAARETYRELLSRALDARRLPIR